MKTGTDYCDEPIFLSILFVYGTGFIVILTINIFSTIIFYDEILKIISLKIPNTSHQYAG